MHTEAADRPLPPEFPLGIMVAFLAMAGVFAASPASDKPLLVGFCLTSAVIALAFALMMRNKTETAPLNHH